MSQATPPELRALEQASAGLLYPSETDAPFEAFTWPAATKQESPADALAARAAKRRVRQVPLDAFFKALESPDQADRFRALHRTLTSTLSGATGFRVGEGERKVDVYLIGRTRSGDWAGLRTWSVET